MRRITGALGVVLLAGALFFVPSKASAETFIFLDVDQNEEVTYYDRLAVYVVILGGVITYELVDAWFPDCVQCNPYYIRGYILGMIRNSTLDIDGDGETLGDPDGQWILQWPYHSAEDLFYMYPAMEGCIRCTPEAMESRMEFLNTKFTIIR